MDTETNDAFTRAHVRIDNLIKCVSRTAALQERLTEDIKNLTLASREALHHTPCRDLCQTMKRLEALQIDSRKTADKLNESHRDWRRWLLDILKFAIVAIVASVATAATNVWQWLSSLK